MPPQAPLRLIKRWRKRLEKGELAENPKLIPSVTRGFYVLYCAGPKRGRRKTFDVTYIGVGGVSENAKSGVGARIKNHAKNKEGWTHCSFFEVHDNITREEILEIESLLLQIFKYDSRVKLANVQRGTKILRRLSRSSLWRLNADGVPN
jgi:hypothetical protein